MFPVKKIFDYCADKLNIPVPKFIIKEMDLGIAAYDINSNKIILNKSLFRRLSKKRIDLSGRCINQKFVDIKEYRFFILAHEIAHYFQHIKYPDWQYKYYIRYLKFDKTLGEKDFKNYSNTKLERNANRIASILLKKARKDKIFLAF